MIFLQRLRTNCDQYAAKTALEFVRDLYRAREREGSVVREAVPDVGETEYVAAVNGGGAAVAVPANVAGALAPYVVRFGLWH